MPESASLHRSERGPDSRPRKDATHNKNNVGGKALTAPSNRLHGWLQRHGVSVLFLAGVCAMSMALSWQIIDLVRQLRGATPTTADATATAQHPPLSVDALQGLFGIPLQQRSDQQAPPTTLQLSLLGSFVNPDNARSTAILLVAGGKPKRLAIGDEISAGVRLHAVHQDHVVLTRNGREESLHFTRQRATAPQPRSVAPIAQQSTTEQLEQLQDENNQSLQQRLEVLRQQMDGDGTPPPPVEEPEAETTP
ncbi:type II secretion system protein N [Aquipseudomonas campi]